MGQNQDRKSAGENHPTSLLEVSTLALQNLFLPFT